MYAVELSQRADKYLQKPDSHLRKRIVDRLKNLEVTPVPKDAKFINRDEGGKSFRYRVGDYRALYKIKEKEKIILIAKIDKRPRVYHR